MLQDGATTLVSCPEMSWAPAPDPDLPLPGAEGNRSRVGAGRKRPSPGGPRRLGSKQRREKNPVQGGGHLSHSFRSQNRLHYPIRLHLQDTNSNIKLKVSRQQSQGIKSQRNALVTTHEASPNSYRNPRPALTSEAYLLWGQRPRK